MQEPVIRPAKVETPTKVMIDMSEEVNMQEYKQATETDTPILQASKKNSWGWLWAGAAGVASAAAGAADDSLGGFTADELRSSSAFC